MRVKNRHNVFEPVSFDKILTRIESLCYDLKNVDASLITKETINNIHDGIKTVELDVLSADICASKSQIHPDYTILGGRIIASNLTKSTSFDFMEVTDELWKAGILNERYYLFCKEHVNDLQNMIDYSRDFVFDYFAMKTLENLYLLKVKEQIVERPQHMWLRVAIQIHFSSSDLSLIRETYSYMSNLYFTHATPTLFNSGLKNNQLSSCFLFSFEDSIDDIFKGFTNCAKISKFSGGIGLSLSNIRAKGSRIHGTNGKSDGIIPLCRTLQEISRYVNQGSKRKGSIAVYLEPWHPDILSFLDLRKNTGDENLRTRDLFTALWVPDLFMKRLEAKEDWSLFCPNDCPELYSTYGDQFETLYLQFEREGKARQTIKAHELWRLILVSQIETGMPYVSYKDHVNSRNMQKQLGVIRNSNLCNEISLYSDSNNIAVCNLASISLPNFVETKNQVVFFNFEKLQTVAGIITQNLNNVIDVNFYPVSEGAKTNFSNRPIGIGVQGLADVFMVFGYSFGSKEAIELNRRIFESIYYGAVSKSIDLAEKHGVYPSFKESPHSYGLLQFMMGIYEKNSDLVQTTLDWTSLLNRLKKYGIRNSVLTAVMPTASTSQLLGNTECVEPIMSNVYVRKTLAGEFTVINKYLVNDLMKLGLWTQDLRDELIYDKGSVQKIKMIPDHLKRVYKTAFEVSNRDIILLAAGRSPFIDQQQSLNLFMNDISVDKLHTALLFGWKNGNKTGCYYLRSTSATNANTFGIDPESVERIKKERAKESISACPRDPILREACLSCSS